MRILIQRPYFRIHSNYPGVDLTRVTRGRDCVTMEVWANDIPGEEWMENGIYADLTLDQARVLIEQLQAAIKEVTE